MATNVKFYQQNEVQDIFSYTDGNGDTQYEKFPRTMEMTVEDVYNYLN